MNLDGKPYRTVSFNKGQVNLINQPLLPFSFEIIESGTYRETAEHIKNMTVRGAPAIGGTAAYSMVQGVLEGNPETAAEALAASRPTAKDLFTAIEFMEKAISEDSTPESVLKAADEYCDRSIEKCRNIGEHGNTLLKNNARILTHCNAG